jgi:hypothetical protein
MHKGYYIDEMEPIKINTTFKTEKNMHVKEKNNGLMITKLIIQVVQVGVWSGMFEYKLWIFHSTRTPRPDLVGYYQNKYLYHKIYLILLR